MGKNEKGYPCRRGRLHVVAIATKRGTGRRRVACFTANSPVTNYPPHVRSARVMFGPKIKTAHLPRRRPTCTVPAALKLRARNLVYGPGRLRLYPFHLTCPPRSADAHTHTHTRYIIYARRPAAVAASPRPAHRILPTALKPPSSEPIRRRARASRVWFVKRKSLLCHFHVTRMSCRSVQIIHIRIYNILYTYRVHVHFSLHPCVPACHNVSE